MHESADQRRFVHRIRLQTRELIMAAPMQQWRREEFDHSPMIVFYEITRACDLMCKHCRADAQHAPDPRELSSASARLLIRRLAQFAQHPQALAP